jgi:hypothetical protein
VSTVVAVFFGIFCSQALMECIMSTVDITEGMRMPQTNEKWGAAIRSLLNKHKLTFRGAETKTGGAVTRTYISEWTAGKLPQYTTALAFLEHFPREEAIECLEAGGFPVPPDWKELIPGAAEAMELLKDPLFKDVVIRLRSSRNPAAIRRVLETAKEILEEEAKEESEQTD